MEGFYGWIRGVVCFICLLQMVLQVLPDGNFQKYVRFFGGLLLLLLVLGPLGKLTGLDGTFEQLWKMAYLQEQANSLQTMGEGMEELRTEVMLEAYEEELRQQVEEVVRTCGLTAEKTELDLTEGNGGVPEVAMIRLRVRVSEEEYEKAVSGIKQELEEAYHISREHIVIHRQE